MLAPNRSREVEIIVGRNPELLNQGKDESGAIVNVGAYEAGRRELSARCGTGLNVDDGHKWGLLKKTDQADLIAPDVLVWLDTREHFDVLAGNPDRASWQPLGVLSNPAWVWTDPAEVWTPGPTPPPDPTPVPPPVPDSDALSLVILQLAELNDTAHSINAELEAANATLERIERDGLKIRFR